MAMEQERGISVTTSVMQFNYDERIVNLLDTPGHEDFSEDTYRTLTAVDSALMVIDGAKGVEPRTVKLLEVCRLRDTPILTFINKLDRAIRDPIELMDEIEDVLQIECAPITWPVGMGREFRGCYHLLEDRFDCYETGYGDRVHEYDSIQGLNSLAAKDWLGEEHEPFAEQIELVKGASHEFELQDFLEGRRSPVFFGTALGNYGVRHMLEMFVDIGPTPGSRPANVRTVEPSEDKFTGFVFKIQANMDPRHRDRIAFMRVCSGRYRHGMRMNHVRVGRQTKITDAVTFMAGDRLKVVEAYAGDIIGLHNHGSIQIGDSFSEGEKMRIDLALLFTWRAVAKLKNSVNTNLLVLDEVFDSSLDASGTDEFLKILYDLTGDVNTFIISHKGEILFDKFNKTIKFEKYKNFSRIVV